jgi:cell division protein FtsW (lipid II flippase)
MPALVCVGACCALIIGQPDFGTAVILGRWRC